MGSVRKHYDVVVAGAGHAGCEAALAAARLGAETLIVTTNLDHIAQMSCNPAVGGIAKGQVVREIDALGGAQARVADASSIQFRMLNRAKGPAVWSPRAQCDKICFQKAMKLEMEKFPGLHILQAQVISFEIEKDTVTALRTDLGDVLYASSFVLANGTFLRGKLHYGFITRDGGRAGDPPSIEMSLALEKQLGLRTGRLKTGTPPRILSGTIDFSAMEKQNSDPEGGKFSYFDELSYPRVEKKDMPCYTVRTTEKTAEIVNENLDKAPMYSGRIEGTGTRYCPSFEDKIVRFAHHKTHLLYLEPEGEFTEEYYANGISTSLPPDVQKKMIHSVPGLEKAGLSRYAYAIEYDFVYPDQITRSLAVKKWPNLFLAGQINGTSGYEEAAGQGLVAGLNAAKLAAGKSYLELGRDTSYIGVMIDDLVTKDIIEPYRLFTSRAEYRLRLRQDNADLRLCEFAEKNGLLSSKKYRVFSEYREKLEKTELECRGRKYQGISIWEHLRNMRGKSTEKLTFPVETVGLALGNSMNGRVFRQLVIAAHYEGYIKREEQAAVKLKKLEQWKIPESFDYKNISGLRNESRLKLEKTTPSTLAQAGRIDGVTPAELALLQVHLKRFKDSIAECR